MTMLFRLFSKAFSKTVNGKNKKKIHGFRYFLAWRIALVNDWCITVQLNKNTGKKSFLTGL